MKIFEKIIQSGKTVFSIDDLTKILATTNAHVIRNYLSRAGKEKILQRLAYGIWGLQRYDEYELACKIYKNSYISFETVLKKGGVIFQHYGDTIFLASDVSREKVSGGKKYKSLKIKDSLLINPLGIEHTGRYAIASLERALCDRIYLSPGYYFDSLENVDFEKLAYISQIYNKRVQKEIQQLIQKYA